MSTIILRISAAVAMLACTSGALVAQRPPAPVATLKSILPLASNAKDLLEKTQRCRDWIGIPYGSSVLLGFIVYPDRTDQTPVVFVSAKQEGFSPWIRALSDQIAAQGFIAIAGDVLTNMGPNQGDSESFATPLARAEAMRRMGPAEVARRERTIQEYALALPAADGQSAILQVDTHLGVIHAAVRTHTAEFELSDVGWSEALGFLNHLTNNRPQVGDINAGPHNAHASHMGHAGMSIAMAPQQSRVALATVATSTVEKQPNLPAGFYTALSTLAKSKLRKEWVDIPYGDIKLHTWVEYPAGEAKAGVVLVMQFGTGMDEWIRAIADQLAQEGFIAVAPDMWSGTGPNGGGRDSFQFVDDAMRAGAKITQDETQRRYKAAWEWAMQLPRANGKSGTIGFCAGGGHSFRFAGEVPGVNASVVYYGTPPDDAVMARIQAPVLGFYGENDARVTSTVESTVTKMEKLGKVYEPHIYPKTTHSFLYFQEMAGNPVATNDAWPRTISFFRQHLK